MKLDEDSYSVKATLISIRMRFVWRGGRFFLSRGVTIAAASISTDTTAIGGCRGATTTAGCADHVRKRTKTGRQHHVIHAVKIVEKMIEHVRMAAVDGAR